MPRVYVEFEGLKELAVGCKEVSDSIGSIRSSISNTVKRLDWDVEYQKDIVSATNSISKKCDEYSQTLKAFQSFIGEAYEEYTKLEDYGKTFFDRFKDELKDRLNLGKVIKGAGYIGSAYGIYNDIKKKNYADAFKDGEDFLEKFSKDYRNYGKISRAVGTTKAAGWWAKKITGLKPLGKVSSAHKPVNRFINNLTNKTSPFKKQLNDTLKDFKGANGVKKAAASWASVILSGISNYKENKEEQALNGNMSDSRVIAETVTETAVETVFQYGANIVVGAAVAAILPAATPGVLVVAATAGGVALVSAGLNAGSKALFGKSAKELVSDVIVDRFEFTANLNKAVMNKIGSGAKKAFKAVGSWFSR